MSNHNVDRLNIVNNTTLMIVLIFFLYVSFNGCSKTPPNVDKLIGKLKDYYGTTKDEKELIKPLVEIGKPAVEPLIAALKDKDWHVRDGSAAALGKIKDPAVEPLIAALKGDEMGDNLSIVRRSVVDALGEIGDPRAVQSLISAMVPEEGDLLSGVPDAIKHAFVKIGKPAVEPLIAALKDKEDSNAKCGAAWSLGEIGDTRSVEPLIAALKDEDADVRLEIGMALSKYDKRIKDARAVEALLTAFKGKDLAVIAGAYGFFIERGEQGTEYILAQSLNKYGYMSMAIDFFNSGNTFLEEEARHWATRKGYKFKGGGVLRDRSGPQWGSRQ